MEKFRLPYLEVAEDERAVRYLGYRLPLTVGEYEVFKAVFYQRGFIDKKKIMEIASSDARLSEKSIAVHISSINKKALAQGGSKLIGFKKNCGYFVIEDV